MANDAENAHVWAEGDVYVADFGTAGPEDATELWPVGYVALGLLGEDGTTEARGQEVKDHYAWGGILVKTTSSKHTREIEITALEDNPAVFELINPGSTRGVVSGLKTSVVKVPNYPMVALGIETRDDLVTRRKLIARAKVREVSEVKDSDSEMTMYKIKFTVFPDPVTKTYYTELEEEAA